MTNRIYVKVVIEDSRFSFTTAINATLEEATEYYVGQTFNFGIEDDKLLKCVALELVATE